MRGAYGWRGETGGWRRAVAYHLATGCLAPYLLPPAPCQVAGQCLIFLIAGFETTSATISYTLFLLASHPEAQRRLQQEVDQHVAARSTAAGGDGSGEAAEAAGGAAEPGQVDAVLQALELRSDPTGSSPLQA